MKKYLANQEPATTKKQLQGQPDRFVAYDNTERPHRSLHRRIPAQGFAARAKNHLQGPRIDAAGYRVRNDSAPTGPAGIRMLALHLVGPTN